MLGRNAKLAQKRYCIIALGITIAKIDIEKPKKDKKKNCSAKPQHVCWNEN